MRLIEFLKLVIVKPDAAAATLANINQKTLQYYAATGLTYLFPAVNLKVTLAK